MKFELDTSMTLDALDELETGEEMDSLRREVEGLEDSKLEPQSLQRQLDKRMSTVEELERGVKRKFDPSMKIREKKEEREGEDEFETNMESNAVDAKDYERQSELLRKYEDIIARLVLERQILLPTVKHLRQLVNEQQLRHDESFVLQQSQQQMDKMVETFEKSVERQNETFEDAVDRILNAFERASAMQGSSGGFELDVDPEEHRKEADDADGSGGEGGEVFECPYCSSEFDSKQGWKTHIGMEHKAEA